MGIDVIRLQELREQRSWSRAELARRSELNPATVGGIENGRLRPYQVQLEKLAAALDVPVTEAHTLVHSVEVEDELDGEHRHDS